LRGRDCGQQSDNNCLRKEKALEIDGKKRRKKDRASDALDDEEDNKSCKGEQESGKERARGDTSE
jgi:hypothetical protein